MRYYPVEPLLALTHQKATATCRAAGVDESTIAQAAKRGGLTERMAERIAVGLNLSPYDVWPEMLEHAIEDCSRVCSNPRCGRPFVPSRSNHRCCTRECSKERYRLARIPPKTDRECAAGGCTVMFLPRAVQDRYCSARCRNREKARRYRARPHGREANRRWRLAYYWSARDYELARNKAGRQRRREMQEAA